MGLLPVEDDRGAGKLFRGDGVRAQGWYRAWPEGSFTVVTCDFTMLLDTLFAVDTLRYLTVRSPMSSSADHGAATGPSAIAYIETRQERVTTPVPAGSHFAYAEVEYFEDALHGAFADLEWNSIGALSALLADSAAASGGFPASFPRSTRSPASIRRRPEPPSSTKGPQRRCSEPLLERWRPHCQKSDGIVRASLQPSSSRMRIGAKVQAKRKLRLLREWVSPSSSACFVRLPDGPGEYI